MKIVGLLLVATGIAALIFQWVNKDDVVKTTDQKKLPTLGWPMYAGAVAMAAGTFILMGRRKKNN